MTLAAQSAKVLFLEAAARSYVFKDPSLSAYLMLQCNAKASLTARSSDEVPDTLIICRACGTTLIPGWTSCTSTLNERSKTKNRASESENGKVDKRQTNYLVVKCLKCYRHVKTPIVPSQKSRERKHASITNMQAEINSKTTATKDKRNIITGNAQSKQRAKARKGGLQALLDKSKQASSPSLGGTLDLMDLMKQE